MLHQAHSEFFLQKPSASVSRTGLVGLITGLLGGALGAFMLAWPPEVPPGTLNYPFTRSGFLIVQGVFFTHHIGLVILLVGLAVSGAAGVGRIVRGGMWLAVAGMVLLTLAELNAMRYVDWDTLKANQSPMGAVYGIACNAVGLGMIIAGVGVLRARVWSGWRRWMPLSIGIATFVELTPGMFGGYVIARLAITFWMLLFAALGFSLRAETA